MVPWLSRYSDKNTVFVDIGAHVGRFAVRMARTVARIYALEPNPSLFNGLFMNLQLNGMTNVHPLQIAASDKREIIEAPWQGENHFFQADRLDSILPESPNLVLIDVEGSEEKVLRGMERFLDSSNPPVLMIEMHHVLFPDKVDVKSIEDYLSSHGYSGAQIASQGRSRYYLAVKTL